MGKPECLITGGSHIESSGQVWDVEVGDQIVTYERRECSACGEGLRNEVVATKRKPQ
jgi:hypothetical protein